MAFNSTPEDIIKQNINGVLGTHSSWSRVPLSFVSDVKNGFAFKSSLFNYDGNGERLIRIRDVLPGDTKTYYSGEIPEGYWVQAGDIIVGMDGDFNLVSWHSKPALLNQRVCRLDIFSQNYDKRFFYRMLPGYLEAVNLNTSSTTVKHLSSKTLNELLIPLPPFAEQKIIADKLDTLLAQVDNTKARLERIPKILNRFRQSVLAAAVSGRLTEEWREQKCITPGRKIKLDEVIESSFYGPRFSKNEYTTAGSGVPTIRTTDMKNGIIKISSETPKVQVADEKLKQFKLSPGDLLITRTGSIGVMALFEGDYIAIPSAYLIRFRLKPSVNKRFIYYALTSPGAQQQMGLSSTAITQPNINAKSIRALIVTLHTLKEQIEIVRRVDQLFAHADRIEQQVNQALARVNNLAQSILAKAFRGELTEQWREENPELISGENSAEALLVKIKVERDTIKKQPKPKRTAVLKKTGSSMSQQIIKVVEALKQAGTPLSGQQLLAAAGYPSDSSTEELEKFFLDIRKALIQDKTIVKLERSEDEQDWFALAEAATNE